MKTLRSMITTALSGALLCAGTAMAATPAASMTPKDPATAPVVAVDRFSDKAGHLQVRTAGNGLPGPNEPVNFDQVPFITQGITPDGMVVRYYNFDVQDTKPAPIYVLFRQGESEPVKGQLHIVDVIPGEPGYNDFRNVHKVTVPRDYQANTATSAAELMAAGYPIRKTDDIVNYPVVPDRSVARARLGKGSNQLQSGWYRGQVVKYFTFEEARLSSGGSDSVPVSPIYVTFNVNPDQPNGGPGSGFRTETGSPQTHNVLQTIPGDAGYSPLWLVNVYDNTDWPQVRDLNTVLGARILAPAVATVNCPVVEVQNKIAFNAMR